jgi:hypothetical protein
VPDDRDSTSTETRSAGRIDGPGVAGGATDGDGSGAMIGAMDIGIGGVAGSMGGFSALAGVAGAAAGAGAAWLGAACAGAGRETGGAHGSSPRGAPR